MTISEKARKIARRIFRITLTTILIIFGILLLIIILIQTGPVQNYVRGKAEAYLENKLHTKVRIGNLYIGFPSRIILKNIYLEDRRKDTLISGGRIEVAISMFRLFTKEINVSNLELENVTLKVKRQMPDSVFNYQFILDAFQSAPPKSPAKVDTSAGFTFVIGTLHFHQIHALYQDDASGNAVRVNLGDFNTKLKKFDPAHQTYDIPAITLRDVSGTVRQYKPILILRHLADTISVHNQQSEPVHLTLGTIDFSQINLVYRDELQNLDAGIRMGNFHTAAESIDLATLHFKLKQIALHNTQATVRFGKIARSVVQKTGKTTDTISHSGAWLVDIAGLVIDSTRLKFDDDNTAPLKKGMDYHHLDVDHLLVNVSAIHTNPSTYQAQVSKIAFDEKSGFVLKKFSTGLDYRATGITLKNFIVQTNYSEIRNQTSLHYRSLADFKKHPGDMTTDLQFDKTRIAVRDLLIFVPSLEEPLKNNLSDQLRLNGKISGRLKDLRIPKLEMEGVGNTALAASGIIQGLPDIKKARFDITIAKLTTSQADLHRLIAVKSFPEKVRIPENISVNGKFTGTIKRFFVDLHTITSNGNADVKGTMDLNNASYDLSVSSRSLDLGHILKQDSLFGKITLDATAKGTGFEPKKMDAQFHLNLLDGEIKSYGYRGLLLDAQLHQGTGTISSSMKDPNLRYQLQAHASFASKFPAVQIKLQLDTINLQALKLASDSLQMHLVLQADFKNTDPDQLQGIVSLSDLGMTRGSLSIHTDSVHLRADHTDTAQSIQIRSEAADLDWTGQYKLTQVSASFKQFINSYYKLAAATPNHADPERWQMAIHLKPSPLVLAIMPSLKGTDSLSGSVQFNSTEKKLALAFHDDKVQINQQVIHQLNITVDTKEKSLDYLFSVADAGKPGFQLNQTLIYGSLANDKLTTTLDLKDKKLKNKYILSGVLSQVNNGLRFVLNPDSILLNYQHWRLPADNFIHYDSSGIIVRNLKLEQGRESIEINTNGETTKSPLDVSFANFKIKTISQFAEQDSTMLGGTINGKAEVKNLFTKPLFTSDLKIDSLMFEKDTLGNLVLQIKNDELDAFIAHIALKGQDNDLVVDGKYFSGESKMDMDVNVNQLNLASFKGMVFSQVRNMSGYLKGNLHASGNLDKPLLKGTLHFDHAVLIPVITGEPLRLSDDRIDFDEQGFDFDNFVLVDSAGNKATLDGNVYTKDFKNYQFDLSFSAQNFRAVNAPKEPNRMFYGKLNLNADIDMKGDMNLPKITSYLRVNKNTDFYVILPSDDPEVVDRNGVVIFVNHNKSVDSAQFKSFLDSLSSNARLKGMDVAATIETDSSAQFTLIIDERNGDALALRGRADLTGGIDKSGKISLTGNYELVNGSYNLTLSVLHRNFQIQRGSTITWTGDPKTANIDITAIYTVNTAPIDLVEQQLSGESVADQNRYKQRLPFQVKLNMTGELLKPIIKFDIALPDNLLSLWPEVDTKLVQMRTDEAEVNKQVFALLLLGRFIQENPFQTAGAPTDAGTIAKQSASKLLSDQLNQLAGSLIKGVDVSFDMNSDQDYSSGSATNQTDLNLKVSKSLFEDRIRVTVGSDFQLEQTNPGQNANNIAGDVSIDYKLSKDGRYMLRVYRNDQYETIVQGQVVETGVSFILTFDYNKFAELFRNKKETPAPPPPKPHKKTPVTDGSQASSADNPSAP